MDSEFYLIEQRLQNTDQARQHNESIQQWVERLQIPALNQLYKLHYRLRFDPLGLPSEQRQQLGSRQTRGWRISRTKLPSINIVRYASRMMTSMHLIDSIHLEFTTATFMTSVPLLITAPHPCSYLEGEQAQTAFVNSSFELNTSVYSQLIAHGFRRSGDDVYRPQCAQCSQCVPVRMPVAQFKPSRRQKRCLQKNRQTTAIIKPAVFDQAHYDLYLRYQNQRHAEGNMANSSPDDYIRFLGSSWCNTQFIEFSIADELAAVAIVDRLDNAVSAVYTFFDPKFSGYSLGVYAVLWQIQYAQKQGLDWLYLGFWIADCQKMNYKDQYQPLQGFIDQKWNFLNIGNPEENIYG